jgi:hypothetical protein
MKNPIILFIYLIFGLMISLNAQKKESQDINVKVSNGFADQLEQGLYDNGDGTITVVEVAGTGFVSLKKLGMRADQTMDEYAQRNRFLYKFISETTRKTSVGVFPKCARTYQITNPDGSAIITKEMAIEKIKELKELLDLGIISQEDFDKKTIEYKEIILK